MKIAFWGRATPLVGLFSSGISFAIALVFALQQPVFAARSAPTSLAPPPAPIYTWIGNTPDWNRKLHISGYRMGCDDGDPMGCVGQASDAVRDQGLSRIFLSMPVDAQQTPLDALVYSRLSVSRPFLVEAGFDDFVGRYKRLFLHPGIDPPSWLRQVISNVKSQNPHLAFGITLYEDELSSPYIAPPDLPQDLAHSVDYVHLFLHYRTDAPMLAHSVQQTQTIFPNAKVIVGLYAYDRINYIPCSPGGWMPCTTDQELHLFDQSVQVAAQLLKQGRIAGIEFYPGFFGKEDTWGGWRHPDYCDPRRVSSCIANTRVMRAAALKILSSELQW